MWNIYDELIEGIPEDITVTDCCLGIGRSYVEAEGNLGMAMVFSQYEKTLPTEIIGGSLKDAAKLSKSWNFCQASLGVAAINAYYNHPEKIKNANYILEEENNSIIQNYSQLLKGKNVAVIGHFNGIEKYQSICNMTILEKNLCPGDLPDSACEYILPHQDYVFITGSAMVNKTLPRLLQLSHNAQTILVGPSVTMSPILFKYGADVLAGTIPKDIEAMKAAIRQGGNVKQFSKHALRARIIK